MAISEKYLAYMVYYRAGAFCTYSAGNQLTTSLDTVLNVTRTNLDNLETFFSNTVDVSLHTVITAVIKILENLPLLT